MPPGEYTFTIFLKDDNKCDEGFSEFTFTIIILYENCLECISYEITLFGCGGATEHFTGLIWVNTPSKMNTGNDTPNSSTELSASINEALETSKKRKKNLLL